MRSAVVTLPLFNTPSGARSLWYSTFPRGAIDTRGSGLGTIGVDSRRFASASDKCRPGRWQLHDGCGDRDRWSCTGGSITSEGLYTAGETGGVHTIRAESDGHEVLAEVRIVTQDEPVLPPSLPGEQTIRWRSEVPAQKWMNFYTKVLSKYATSPSLKIEVGFSVSVDREQVQGKAAETKSALRELGLDDDVAIE
jgi:hypothetical protein